MLIQEEEEEEVEEVSFLNGDATPAVTPLLELLLFLLKQDSHFSVSLFGFLCSAAGGI